MGRCIIKLTDEKTKKDYYLEWSSNVDAPVTYGMSLDELKEYYKEEYGDSGMRDLPICLKRVELFGSSMVDGSTVEDVISANRAGKKEKCLSKEEIIERYCVKKSA